MDSRIETAKLHVLEFLTRRYAASVELTRVEALPTPPYGFDPEGWIVFAYVDTSRRQFLVGGSEYVAVNSVTGEVKVLGRLGE